MIANAPCCRRCMCTSGGHARPMPQSSRWHPSPSRFPQRLSARPTRHSGLRRLPSKAKQAPSQPLWRQIHQRQASARVRRTQASPHWIGWRCSKRWPPAAPAPCAKRVKAPCLAWARPPSNRKPRRRSIGSWWVRHPMTTKTEPASHLQARPGSCWTTCSKRWG